MKSFALIGIFGLSILFQSCSHNKTQSASYSQIEKQVSDLNGCVLVYSLQTKQYVAHLGSTCTQRISPCSTFKIPIALMAFNEGVLQNETSFRRWDGKEYNNPGWNHDQTARSWMLNSVVWFSQLLTKEIGFKKIEEYLAHFQYGNQDFSAGVSQAWLDSSLKISPEEQIEFLKLVWEKRLPVSYSAAEKTINILPEEIFLSGTLKGKTGSSGLYMETAKNQALIGWYVGYYTIKGRHYVLSSSYLGPRGKSDLTNPGLVAKHLLKEVLAEKI